MEVTIVHGSHSSSGGGGHGREFSGGRSRNNNNFYYYSNARSIPFYFFSSKLGPLNLLYYLFIKKNQ